MHGAEVDGQLGFREAYRHQDAAVGRVARLATNPPRFHGLGRPDDDQRPGLLELAGDERVEFLARRDLGIPPDGPPRYAALYRPSHLIGLELGISVASVGLRREATGAPRAWAADAVATAKRDLAAGELLDGEGGYLVYGKLLRASESRRLGALPIGLAHGVRLLAGVKAGEPVRQADVALDEGAAVVRARRELETALG